MAKATKSTSTTKKAAPKKAAAKKPAAKKAAAPKSAASRSTAAKSATAKTAAPKKEPAKKAQSKPAVAKPAAAKPTAAKPTAAKTAKTKPAAAKPAVKQPEPKAAPKAAPARKEKLEFAEDDYVVYPTHGVGQVTGIETHEIAGEKLKLFVISFERERMTLKVPIAKVKESGLRKLSNRKVIDTALKTLKGRSRVKRTMWSRRAQEYEAKINSGDPVSIAEVVRDLHRNEDQPDQSYSERQMYQAALDRLARELAAVESTDHEEAVEKLEKLLAA
jgi:CarD family transcriptional regulator